MKKVLIPILVLILVMGLGAGAALASPGDWTLNPDPNAEVSVVGNTVTMGQVRAESPDQQPLAVHGASMELPPAASYQVTFTYDLYTWDSYNAPGTPSPGGTGYWDSFSISVSQDMYWNLSLTDPINGDPLDLGYGPWGGVGFGDGTLETASGTATVTIPGDPLTTNYLNVVLDTATTPENNGNYGSWGEIEIVNVGIDVDVDIKPQSCPNPLKVGAKGVLPVAILGTEDFDVTQVDPASVMLEGVPPLRWALEDVATPYEGNFNGYCHELGPDGYLDLSLKFKSQEVAEALGEVSDGDVLVLQLTGNLMEEYGGTSIVGEDVIVIIKK